MSIGEAWRRVWYRLNRKRIERELEAEMAAHRAMLDDPRRFGNTLRLREESRDAWGWGWADRAGQDLRQGLRALLAAPGFAIAAALILTLGIGLNLTFVHILNVVALRPLPVRDPATLVRLERRSRNASSSGMPYPATEFIRQHNDVLAAVITRHTSQVFWEGDPAGRTAAAFVSANWFSQQGYGAALGRVFGPMDEEPDAAPVAVLSHRVWTSRLGADPGIIGRPIRLNGQLATVVGIAPPAFPDLDLLDPQIWLPITQIDYFEAGNRVRTTWNDNNIQFFARLAPGVSPGAAADALRATMAALAHARPDDFRPDEWLEAATAEHLFLHARDRQKLLALAGLFGGLTLLVLVVASANLASLVLSRVIGRVHELSVRVALGASRWRILRQIVIECGLVAGAGAAGGLLVGYLSARMLAVAMDLPPYLDFTPDLRLGLAALGAAALSMLAFGLVPAWSVSRRDLVRGIRDGGHQASSGLARARLQRVLIGVQVLGSCALLVVAGAMARGLQRVVAVDPGVTFDRAVVLAPSLERHGLSPEAAQDYWSRLVLALSSRPDIEGVALADSAPFSGAVNQSRYGASSGSLSIAVLHVEPRFFSLLGIPLVAGRTFEPADGPSAVIISRRLAETMYGGLEALGRGYPRNKPTRVIVGIAEDSMVARLRASNVAEEYAPIGPAHLAHAVLVVQGRNAPERLLAPLYRAARLADPRIQPEVRVLAADYARHLRGPTLMGTIAALTAALVLLLACVGIFGMVAYGVKLRAKEIGIRRALGADTARVCATLVRQLTWPMALGMFAGTPVGILASRLLGGAPFHLAVADATASGSALALFALAASTAALLPAFRALNVDPLRALRQD